MAVLSTAWPTLLDLAKRTDPDGAIALIAEILTQQNEMLLDIPYIEGNLPTGHRTTIRTGLPSATWRKLYGGVQPSKSTTAQVTNNTGMLEAYAEVDKALADLNGNTAAFRLSEDRAFIESMSQMMGLTTVYGNEGTQPEAFTGLMPYVNISTGNNSDNVIKAGGASTDNQSIVLVVWGENTVHGIVPKGSPTGLQSEDKGQVTIENVDGNGGRMEAYRSHYRWDAGLVVRDWRYLVRVCNISKAALTVDGATGPKLPELMFQALEMIPNLAVGRAAFYMSRGVRTKLRQQSSNYIKNSTLTIENEGGVPLMSFHGIPVRRMDVMGADEALVA